MTLELVRSKLSHHYVQNLECAYVCMLTHVILTRRRVRCANGRATGHERKDTMDAHTRQKEE